MDYKNLGELAALATAFCWTISSISFESAGKKVGSLMVNYLKLMLGFIFVSTYSFVTRGLFLPVDATPHNWIWLSLSGFIGLFLGDLFLFQAYVEVGARITMLIMASSPPLTALLEFVFFNVTLDYKATLGMLITILGIAIVILGKEKNEKKLKLYHSSKGIIYAFLGSLGQAIGLLISKIGMKGYSSIASTQIRIISGFIGFTFLFIFLNKFTNLKLTLRNRKAMKLIVIGSLFGPFLGITLSLISLKYTSASISSTITSITPVTIIPFSIIFFKEKVRFKEIVGAILAVIGVAILFL